MTSLFYEPFINQRILAEMSGHSLGVVNRSIKALIHNGYLDEHCQLTACSRDIFKKCSPRNAIILAAGFGMRMVPINMTTPKALLEVNGERLIDRLVSQLHEVGVNDITVVVGFMKDSFEYLVDEYGVKLVYNEKYASHNNIISLNIVNQEIGNTYIIPCDIWCDRNPFRRHELYSWYMVSNLVDDGSDVRVNRKMELVKVSNASGGNGMIGIAYLTKDKAEIVRGKLDKFSKAKEYAERFWEESLYENNRMIVQARLVHSSDVVEINTYEQLRDLDSDSNTLKSDALKIISEKLECKESDIVNIEVLKKGMTNRSFLFTVHDKKYIMRIPGEGTDQLINRSDEAAVYETIKGYKLCDDLVYINPNNGYKISKYIEDVRCCDIDDTDDLKRCIEKLHHFHSLKLTVPHTFDIYQKIEFYEELWDGLPSIYKDYKKTKDNVWELRMFVEEHALPYQLTHIDAVPDNFLFDPHRTGELSIQLTDWEYAGMQDPHVDIAMFCIYAMYDKKQIDRMIGLYFDVAGEKCDNLTCAKIYAYIAMSGLLWSNWCEYKRNLGVEFGEYSLRQYRYAKEFYRYAKELIEKERKEGIGLESR